MLNSHTMHSGYQLLRLQPGRPSWQTQPGKQPRFCPKLPENRLCLSMAFTKEDFLVPDCTQDLPGLSEGMPKAAAIRDALSLGTRQGDGGQPVLSLTLPQGSVPPRCSRALWGSLLPQVPPNP